MKRLNIKAFTLIEIMVATAIISTLLIAGFSAYIKIGYGKISLIEQTEIQRNSFYFSEKLFQLIKEGGTVDYEEYFNRKVISGTEQKFKSGHYLVETGFGNFGEGGVVGINNYGQGYYYCRSGYGDDKKMQKKDTNGTYYNDGCYSDPQLNNKNINYEGVQQRYGQYSFHFIDYNGNNSEDGGNMGDEDGDGNIIGDDDDEYLGVGPEVFGSGSNVHELYLSSGDKRFRTFIRLNQVLDKDATSELICNSDSTDKSQQNGCRGVIEFIKLEGVDWGLDHNNNNLDSDGSQYDGVIDTWLIDSRLTPGQQIVAGSVDMTKYRTPLFPETVNVTEFRVFVYPNIDYDRAWKDSRRGSNISPYVIINYKIKPSLGIRKRIGSEGREINMNLTINLTEIFSK